MAKKEIPNPNQRQPLTPAEKEILQADSTNLEPKPAKKKTSGHMITVPDDVWQDLEKYMDQHPEEGSKSGLITRLIAEHLKKKKNE